jgi:hypothetical protein
MRNATQVSSGWRALRRSKNRSASCLAYVNIRNTAGKLAFCWLIVGETSRGKVEPSTETSCALRGGEMEPANSTASTTNCWKPRMLFSLSLSLVVAIVSITLPTLRYPKGNDAGDARFERARNPLGSGIPDLAFSLNRSEGAPHIRPHFSAPDILERVLRAACLGM